MSRSHFASGLILLSSLLVGCESSTPLPAAPTMAPGKQRVEISGVVRLPNGAPVPYAKVTSSTGGTVFADPSGAYSLRVPAGSGGVTLDARDGFEPGVAYGETHFGTSKIVVRSGAIRNDIVLDQSAPI